MSLVLVERDDPDTGTIVEPCMVHWSWKPTHTAEQKRAKLGRVVEIENNYKTGYITDMNHKEEPFAGRQIIAADS